MEARDEPAFECLGLDLAQRRPALALGGTYGSSFLPDFNEGSVTLFLNVPVGTSLVESDRAMGQIERQVQALPGFGDAGGKAVRDEVPIFERLGDRKSVVGGTILTLIEIEGVSLDVDRRRGR